MNWHDYFMNIAKVTALRSKDPKHKVGCVLVDQNKHIVSTGYNGMPRMVGAKNNDSLEFIDWDSKVDKQQVIHAEMNALLFKSSPPYAMLTAYCTMEPCVDCLKHFVQANVLDVYYLEPMSDKWRTKVWKRFFKNYCIAGRMLSLIHYKMEEKIVI